VSWQALVLGVQHAPASERQALTGWHKPGVNTPVQDDCRTKVHWAEAGSQQAPGQGLGWQGPPSQPKVPMQEQWVWAVSVHTPVSKQQHAPMGGGHGLGWHRPGEKLAVHDDCTTKTHCPVAGSQHAPSQGPGWQTPARQPKVPMQEQLDWAVSVHAPVSKQQHAPRHGLGEQLVPAPENTRAVPVHPEASVN
jgi:hypothetical protein